jgi:KaiC/GvpD/RAD55 family RecA-like ATPase
MTNLIKTYFPSRSDEDKIKINRNFLKDVEPFSIEKLVEYAKNIPEGSETGFKSLDEVIKFPSNDLTLITGLPKHGKTNFMLNILLNMCSQKEDHHFLFYTYDEPKWEVITKVINMCGNKQFNDKDSGQSNLERWKHEFKHSEINTLMEKSDKNKDYRGLKHFLEISSRIFVIDTNHNLRDLIDSIKSFNKTFKIGAVFIDSLHKIKIEEEKKSLKRVEQLQDIYDQLKTLTNNMHSPLLFTIPIDNIDAVDTPEYDQLELNNLMEPFNSAKTGGLIIGLQNYSKSQYIGSLKHNNFTSNFYSQPLKKAEKMPDNLKDMMHKTIILVKVLANYSGKEGEIELLYNKQLFKISDLDENSIK